MESEPAALDPREVKVLADILALVVEDQPGPSAVALDTLRRKAQQSRVTGGALKNLFQSIAARPPEPLWRSGGDSLANNPDAVRDAYERLRAANRNLERALASANTEAARLQADLDDVQARLVEAQQNNRGLAERWRGGRRQATYMAAAIGVCCVVIVGLTVARLTQPAAPARLVAVGPAPAPPFASRRHDEPPRAPAQRHAAAASRPPPPAGAEPPAAPTDTERDPELEQALQQLSRSAAVDGAPHPTQADPEADPAAPAAQPAVPAAPSGPLAPPPAGARRLSPETYTAIVSHVRTCWRGYVSRLADPRFKARLQVVTDESGVVRQAQLAPDERAHLTDPSFENYVRAAMRSVLDPDCAQLPIPPADLGHKIVFDFVFVP